MSAPTTATSSFNGLIETWIINQSLAATYTSPSIPKELQTGVFIQAVITAGTSPTGTFKIQCSADNAAWTDVASSSQAITDNGNVVWNIQGAYYKFFRVVYTRVSGTGTLNLKYNMI